MREYAKGTIWNELDAERVEIIEVSIPEGGTVEGGSVRLKHPSLLRARYFTFSRAGNWYSRYTGRNKQVDPYAQGYIIKEDITQKIKDFIARTINKLKCRNCGWQGNYAELIEGVVCPVCKSYDVLPADA